MLPRLLTPSCSCKVSVMVSPQLPFAVKVKSRPTVCVGAIAPYDCGPEGASTLALGCKVATRLVVAPEPLLTILKVMVAVSPGSTAPLEGGQLSLTRVEPAGERLGPQPRSRSSVVATVVVPLKPPAATSLLPTAAPPTNDRATLRLGPGDQLSEAGS